MPSIASTSNLVGSLRKTCLAVQSLTPWVARMMAIEFGVHLIAGQSDLFRIDDHDMVAHVYVRCEGGRCLPRSMLPLWPLGAQGLAFGVHEIPFLLHFSWLL